MAVLPGLDKAIVDEDLLLASVSADVLNISLPRHPHGQSFRRYVPAMEAEQGPTASWSGSLLRPEKV